MRPNYGPMITYALLANHPSNIPFRNRSLKSCSNILTQRLNSLRFSVYGVRLNGRADRKAWRKLSLLVYQPKSESIYTSTLDLIARVLPRKTLIMPSSIWTNLKLSERLG